MLGNIDNIDNISEHVVCERSLILDLLSLFMNVLHCSIHLKHGLVYNKNIELIFNV